MHAHFTFIGSNKDGQDSVQIGGTTITFDNIPAVMRLIGNLFMSNSDRGSVEAELVGAVLGARSVEAELVEMQRQREAADDRLQPSFAPELLAT